MIFLNQADCLMLEGRIQIVTAQKWLFVIKESSGMEGKVAHLQKRLNWMEMGIPETEGLPLRESSFP